MALSQNPKLTKARKGPACSVCQALSTLPPEDAAVLTEWMSNATLPFTDIARATEEDPDTPTLKPFALSRHARGGCDARVRLRP